MHRWRDSESSTCHPGPSASCPCGDTELDCRRSRQLRSSVGARTPWPATSVLVKGLARAERFVCVHCMQHVQHKRKVPSTEGSPASPDALTPSSLDDGFTALQALANAAVQVATGEGLRGSREHGHLLCSRSCRVFQPLRSQPSVTSILDCSACGSL